MLMDEDDYLEHYGTPRHSGRYPWGSGGEEEGSTRNKSFLDGVGDLRKQGMKDTEIAKAMGLESTTALRAKMTMEKAALKQARISHAQALQDKGMSTLAISRQMGLPEPTTRALLAPGAAEKAQAHTATANMLKAEVAEKGLIDVGKGNETHLGISKEKLNVAVAMLKEEGYEVHNVPQPQVATGLDTHRKVLCPPGTTWAYVRNNQEKIQLINQVSSSHGQQWGRNDYPPIPIAKERVKIKYDEEGGSKLDGVIYVRPGIEELSLGGSRYAQVRIQIGDGHYLKGMAMHNDDLPKGTDLLFHTNKTKADLVRSGKSWEDYAMKPLTGDPEYPFGSVVRQLKHNPDTPDEKVYSAMNIVNKEGEWQKWNRNISAQALSKQSPNLAKQQLEKTFEARKNEFDEIMSLTNPTVRKKLLESFSESTDKAAVHLKAAGLERQNWHVILPIESMKRGEIYAPKYDNGEKVALIRYPHGGVFEVPDLIVNNRNREARRLLADARDAVGIHHSVAEHLSGADFDGDTVLVIPNNQGKIKVSRPLDGLKGFDAKRLYKLPEGVKFSGNKQMLMGEVSNLITDMTLHLASHDEIARAVRHSMVVIDAEKHDLDHKLSYRQNSIGELRKKYQEGPRGGASTLISRAKSKKYVPDRKGRPESEGGPIDRETGEKRFVPTNKKRFDGQDKLLKSTKLAETSDAHDLSSGTPMEKLYADHSNRLKSLANQARLSQINTPNLERSPSAARVYSDQVKSLSDKLLEAKRNSPLERQAQAVATQAISLKRQANPHLEKDSFKKIRFRELETARNRLGAKKKQIVIDDDEWDAIQQGAISNHKLREILDNADLQRVRQLATPRPDRVMTNAKATQARLLLGRGYTMAEVAKRLNVSINQIDLAIIGDDQPDEED